jgi:hypothetical protein
MHVHCVCVPSVPNFPFTVTFLSQSQSRYYDSPLLCRLAYSAGAPAPIIGRLGGGSPARGVIHTGNTHAPPGAASAANCTAYAAITAVAVAGRESRTIYLPPA